MLFHYVEKYFLFLQFHNSYSLFIGRFLITLWFKKAPMSSNKNRFWAGSSSSDESSDDYSYSDYSEEEAPKKTQEKSKYVIISESEEEEEKRIVKSPKYFLPIRGEF